MIYTISREIADKLVTRGVPFPVVYGPEREVRTNLGVGRNRIVIQRDDQSGDPVGPARSQRQNPRMVGLRSVGVVVRIYAQSTVEGAQRHDHERLADRVEDAFEVVLKQVVGARDTLYRWRTPPRFLRADELAMQGLGVWPGVVYESRLEIDRGVYDTTYADGSAPGEFALADVASSTTVTVNGVDAGAEVAYSA